ncbi:MAG TPA: triose-phosphate isomerase [Spongiibacteraceae bacterium]|nr:triose-phosphate isomerase [Spongiibacteraceae bacterium]
MRRKLVVGNWKMHGDHAANAKLLCDLIPMLPVASRVEVVVCPPFVYLSAVREQLANSRIKLGAQNVCSEPEGAYTGEVSAPMLRDCGCGFVIVGHSERRQLFGESDGLVATKAALALQQGLTPIVCVGESLAEREAGKTLAVIARQLVAVQEKLSGEDLRRIVVAYEPIWAIGTGRTATPEQAQEVHAFIRQQLREQQADAVPILYGGSVKADNAQALFAQVDIDGGLVGGASLKAEEFAAICKAAE